MAMLSVRVTGILPSLGLFPNSLLLQPIPTCQIPRDRVWNAPWKLFDRLRLLSTAQVSVTVRHMLEQVLALWHVNVNIG